MIGWIKLHRCIFENKYYFKHRFTPIQAWIDLLLLAGHEDKIVIINRYEIKLAPGELCWSQLNLAKRWKWNRKTVVNFLTELKMNSMADTRSAGITTVITIKNWAKYQVTTQELEECTDNDADTTRDILADTKAGTNKKERNLKKLFKNNVSNNFYSENTEGTSGKNKQFDPYSVKARLAYRPDPERAKQRMEEIRKLFRDN